MRWPWSRRREVRSYSSLIHGAWEAAASGAGSPAAAWARSAACELAAGWWSRGMSRAMVKPMNRRTRCLTPRTLSTIARRLAREGEYLAVIDMPGDGLQLREVWQWFVRGGPEPASWMYQATENGPSSTRTRNLPASAVAHVMYSHRLDQPWIGASPASFASGGAALAGGIDWQFGNEANSPHGTLLIDVDQGDAGDRDQGDTGDTDPRQRLKGELAALNGGLGISPTMANGRGDIAGAPPVDYQFRRFGFNPPEAVTALRRQALVDMVGAYGLPAPMVDERAAAAAFREGLRVFHAVTMPAVGALIAEQLGDALGVPDLHFEFPVPADLATRARAIQAMTGAGMALEDALAAVEVQPDAS